jgi:serine/threonine protein kinase
LIDFAVKAILNNGSGKKRILSLGLQSGIVRRMVDCIFQLHTIDGVAHRDIKLDNMTFDKFFRVKFIDFGVSVPINLMATDRVGTKVY